MHPEQYSNCFKDYLDNFIAQITQIIYMEEFK